MFVFFTSSIVSTLNGPVQQTTFNMLLQSKCSHWKTNLALLTNNIQLTATLQPTCNVGKLVKMAFNGKLTLPRKSIFINTRSLHVQDSLTNLNDYQYILSVGYHLLFDIMYYECSLERLLLYTYLTLHLERKFGVSKSCLEYCQHVVDTVVTKNKTGGKKNANVQSKCNLHRLCYDSAVSIFELIESLPLKEYLETLLEEHEIKNVTDDVLSPLSSFITQTNGVDDDFVQLILLLKQRLKKLPIKGDKCDNWELIKTNLNDLSHLCSLDGKAAALLEESCPKTDISLNVAVFGSYKFTCASIVDACIQFKTKLYEHFDVFKQQVIDEFALSYNRINKQHQFKQMIGYNYDLWTHWHKENGKLVVIPTEMSNALLEYVAFGVTQSLTNADYDYIFKSCMDLAFNHNWKCTASNYGTKYNLENNFIQLIRLVYGKMVTVLTLSHCTPDISKEENRKDGLHKLPELLKPSFTELKTDDNKIKTVEIEHKNPWLVLPDKQVWEAAGRWQTDCLEQSLPPVLVSLSNVCGQYQQQLKQNYLRCVELDKDYAKEECLLTFLNAKSEEVVMPSVQQLESSVEEYDKYRDQVKNINIGITHDQQRFNQSRAVSVEILDTFRDSSNNVLKPLQVYGNEMMKVKEQRQDCWIKNVSLASSECFSLWTKVKHFFGGQSQLPVSGNIQTVAAFGQPGPAPFIRATKFNSMEVNTNNFGGIVNSDSDSDEAQLMHVGCGDWSKMIQLRENHVSDAMECILEFIRANLETNLVPVNTKVQLYLLEPYCKLVQEACGSKYTSIYQLLTTYFDELKFNLVNTMIKDIVACLLVFKRQKRFPLVVINFVALVWRVVIFQPKYQAKFYSLCMYICVFKYLVGYSYSFCVCL